MEQVIPAGWQSLPLEQLCEILDSQRKPITKKDRISGIYPYYGATGLLDHVDNYLFDEALVLLGEDGAKWEAGNESAYRVSGKTWINNHAHVLRPKRNYILDSYLVYFLNFQNLMPYVTGTTVPKLNQEKMRSIPIFFPPLAEQEQIVKKLDDILAKIDCIKANTQTAISATQDLLESYINNAFIKLKQTETNYKISEIATIKGGKRIPKGRKLTKEKTQHPYIRVADFNEYGTINLNDIHYITDDIYAQIKNYTISPKDLYISIAGTIGKAGVIPVALDGANLTENACKLVLKENICNKFIYYFTKTKYFIEETRTKTKTAAQPKLALTRLSTIYVPIPAMKKQEEMVEYFDKVSNGIQQLEQIYKQKLTLLDELKQSVLHQAFQGELL